MQLLRCVARDVPRNRTSVRSNCTSVRSIRMRAAPFATVSDGNSEIYNGLSWQRITQSEPGLRVRRRAKAVTRAGRTDRDTTGT